MDQLSGAGRPETTTSGSARTASGKRLVEGRLTASGSTVLLGEVLRSWRRGQYGLRCTGGRQFLGGGSPAAMARGPNPASTRAEDASTGSGVDPGTWAELLRGSQVAGLQWIDRPTAEPKLDAAERIVAAARGFAGGRFGGLGPSGMRGAN
jgi:hypothetical protein